MLGSLSSSGASSRCVPTPRCRGLPLSKARRLPQIGLAALVELDIKVEVSDPVLFVFLNRQRTAGDHPDAGAGDPHIRKTYACTTSPCKASIPAACTRPVKAPAMRAASSPRASTASKSPKRWPRRCWPICGVKAEGVTSAAPSLAQRCPDIMRSTVPSACRYSNAAWLRSTTSSLVCRL